ncbi:MAG: DNA polymerase III subunit beta [Erysipelotrichaceae bacterium]|nr:DNA polymerase III subunit beta [Erysipelotrichaceae bacterium]
MKILCSKENLNRAMNIVSRAIPVRTTMDIMRCVLLQAELDTLKLTANDMSLGIETTITAFVTEPGYVAIDASLFSAIVRKLPDSEISIESDAYGGITIRCENSKFDIAGRGTDDFVYLPAIDVLSDIHISQFTLREMIGQVIFSTADSEINAAMSGVYVEVLGDRIRMTTLDGHRISVRVNELDGNYTPVTAIVPGKTFSDLSKIIAADHEKDMTVSFARNHIVFEFDETKVVSRLIDGEYFKIESMLREEYETRVKVNKRMFLDCLDRSTLLTNESDKKPVIIEIEDGEMRLRLKSSIGSMNEALPVDKEGRDLKIAFNPKLLMDALRVIDEEEIDIYLVKYNYPCTIKDDKGSYNYVVLPVNFTED